MKRFKNVFTAKEKQMHRCLDAKMHSPNNVKDYASMPPCLYASKIAFTLAEKFSPRPLRDTSQANEQRELCDAKGSCEERAD